MAKVSPKSEKVRKVVPAAATVAVNLATVIGAVSDSQSSMILFHENPLLQLHSVVEPVLRVFGEFVATAQSNTQFPPSTM